MNRRNFIQTLTTAGIATSMPINLVTDVVRNHKCVRRTETDDYNATRTLYVRVQLADGPRHSVRKLITDYDWYEMTGAQREATWRRLEMLALEYASGRAAA